MKMRKTGPNIKPDDNFQQQQKKSKYNLTNNIFIGKISVYKTNHEREIIALFQVYF